MLFVIKKDNVQGRIYLVKAERAEELDERFGITQDDYKIRGFTDAELATLYYSNFAIIGSR